MANHIWHTYMDPSWVIFLGDAPKMDNPFIPLTTYISP